MPIPVPPLGQPRILVTGGGGFLGRHLLDLLAARGYTQVAAPRRADYDLTQRDQIIACLRDVQPDAILHLAAVVGGIGANRDRPGDFFYQNLIMGTELMEQARRAGVGKFVAVGTICAYPKFTPVPFREDDLWDGYPEETNAPYGLAKKMLLVQAQAYRAQYGFDAIYLLPTNLYGPGDNFDLESGHVIPALIRKCIEARRQGDGAIVAWGSGAATRDYLYVDDAAEGILLAAERYDGAEPVNLSGTEATEISVRELAAHVCRLTGYAGEVVWDTSQPDGQPRRSVDGRRARELFGFAPRVAFEAGLRRTITWYEQHGARGGGG
jgi:GDP-L-fucose synthase